ncbi:MAG: class I SAM-dependent methyltransferase [Gammaproteobacteria bacterium]|nr:class I SAM-dependent methyltransferase [Gammaproteobacteria bacterium]
MADVADRHQLYEMSVQSVETEVEFLGDTYRSVRGRPAISLREDFCGTAAAACEWIKVNPEHTAIGIDIDGEVLEWGLNHHIAKLDDAGRARLRIVEDDVLHAEVEPVDILTAFNFSYWIFKTRDSLRNYFAIARDGLKDDGLFFIDAFGGSEAHDVMEEETEHDGFTYIWQQGSFDPITHDLSCYIHFEFPDGSRLKRAFSYHWRLWMLPELQELLTEAGFSNVTVYWQQEDDDDDEEEGDFEPATRGEPDPAWIAYIVAEK